MKTDCQKEHGKQKRVAEEEVEDQRCDGKIVSNETLKGQERMWKAIAEDRRKWRVLTMKVKEPSDLDHTTQGSKEKKEKKCSKEDEAAQRKLQGSFAVRHEGGQRESGSRMSGKCMKLERQH